jgi:hypothetical protein
VGDFIEKRLGLSPGQNHVYQCGDNADQRAVEDETRFDTSRYPQRKYEWQDRGCDRNGREKGRLPEEMEDGENDGEDRQFRGDTPHNHPSPMQMRECHRSFALRSLPPAVRLLYEAAALPLGTKFSDAEFMQYRNPVGFGPSSNT